MKDKIKTILKDNGKVGFAITLMAVGFISGMVFLATTGEDVIEQSIKMREWHPNVLGEANPGAGASGVLTILIVKSSTFSYYTNISETVNSTVYGFENVNNSHMNGDIPYGTNFHIVAKVRWNATHAFESTNNTWMHSYVRGNITCSALSLSDAAMTEYNISGTGNGDYIWMHYVIGPYTISRGQNVTSCSFNFDAYY